MKTKTLVAIVLLIISFSTVACTAASAGTVDGTGQGTQEIAITNSDEFDQNQNVQEQVEIAKGSTLVVELFSNGTTGFSWNENAQIGDTAIIQQLNHQYINPETDAIGAPGAEQWTFKMVKTGTTTVHLEYGRPWEGGEKGIWTFDLTVTVK